MIVAEVFRYAWAGLVASIVTIHYVQSQEDPMLRHAARWGLA